MFAALRQPLEVREVGGDTLLESLAGPALIAVAAILAAIVAAYVARKNHSEQLDNDRAMRDLDHARRETSAAVETISEAVDALSEFANAVWSASEAHKRVEEAEAETDAKTWVERLDDGSVKDTRTPEEIEATSPTDLRNANDLLEREVDLTRKEMEAIDKAINVRRRVSVLLTRLLADTFRLRISIGTTSEVADRHADVARSFKDWFDEMAPQDDGSFRFDTFPGDGVPVQEPIADFVEACQRWSADRDRALKQESPPGLDPDDTL